MYNTSKFWFAILINSYVYLIENLFGMNKINLQGYYTASRMHLVENRLNWKRLQPWLVLANDCPFNLSSTFDLLDYIWVSLIGHDERMFILFVYFYGTITFISDKWET